MYARSVQAPKKRRPALLRKFVAPVSGWVANRALAEPQNGEGPGAAILDNFFPRATSVNLRRGKQRYATLQDLTLPVTALFTYKNGNNERLFGANETTIYDLSNVIYPEGQTIGTYDGDEISDGNGNVFGWDSTFNLDVLTGTTSGDWVTAQFAATGNTYLIGVNGVDTGFIFDGSTFYPYVDGGVFLLPLVSEVAPFVVGEIVTGAVSGAVGTVHRIDGASLILIAVTGSFQAGEDVLGDIAGNAETGSASTQVAPGPTFPSGLTSADMNFVWVYKSRLYFVQKDSMNVYYAVNVDSVGGQFDVLPFGGLLAKGGSVLFGSPWSMEASEGGGLSEQCAFVSTEGEVVIFQGNDPASAQNWNKVGTYRIGRPLGNRAHFRGGGDLVIATSVGLVPLSKAISLDMTALTVATISYPIADAWAEAVQVRGDINWQCQLWPEGKMAIISPPNPVGVNNPVVFVVNAETGAWCRFTNWNARSMAVYRNQIMVGSEQAKVFTGWAGGNDDGAPYTGIVAPLFEDMGAPASTKISMTGRARGRASYAIIDQLTTLVDFNTETPATPDPTVPISSNVWDLGVWGQSIWADFLPSVISQEWRSVGGLGYTLSPCYQVASGSIAPLDVELISIELTYNTADIIS